MPKIPDSTKNSLHWRLATRARERWPELADVRMRYRAGFAYVDGVLPDGEVLRLCRLRDVSSATRWGFAIYRASHDDYVRYTVANDLGHDHLTLPTVSGVVARPRQVHPGAGPVGLCGGARSVTPPGAAGCSSSPGWGSREGDGSETAGYLALGASQDSASAVSGA